MMPKGSLAFALCLLVLAGCVGTDEAKLTALPYRNDDGILEAFGKTLVNIPVWAAEVALVAVWIWAQTGGPAFW